MLKLSNKPRKNRIIRPVLRAAIGTLFALTLSTQSWGQSSLGSAFTYQGELKLTGEPVNDTADFEFTLWDELENGDQIGSLIPVGDVQVEEGLFNVELDFGVMAFNGDARWLEIAVRAPAGAGEFTTLTPRQPVTAAPYALQTRGIFVDDAGNVGIGTTAPQHLLSVGGDSSDSQDVIIRSYGGEGQWKGGAAFGGDLATVILGESAGVATIGGHNADLSNWVNLAINPGGNVGIGTTAPTAKLHVAGNVNADGLYASFLEANGVWENYTVISEQSVYSYGVMEVWNDQAQAGMYIDGLGQGVVWGDWKFFRADNPYDPETEIWYGCLEGPEQAAYNRGTAQLINGRAVIEFPDHFRAVANAEGMSVYLTPRSAYSKGLAVTELDLDGMVVKELDGGAGDYEFDYLVMAARQGSERFSVVSPVGAGPDGSMSQNRGPGDYRPTPHRASDEIMNHKDVEIANLRARLESLEALVFDLTSARDGGAR